jgi:hypothetical protein
VLGLLCLGTICIVIDVIMRPPDKFLLLMALGILAIATGLVNGTVAQGKWIATLDAQRKVELVDKVSSEIDHLRTELDSRMR